MGASASTKQPKRIIHYHLLSDNDKAYIVDNFKEFYTNNDVTKLVVYDDDHGYYILINTFKICFKYEHKNMLIDFILTLNRPFIFDEQDAKGHCVKFIYQPTL